MFAEYEAEVLKKYKEEKAANRLSLNLIHSTAAKLRDECEAVVTKRYLKKDENVLRTFFGQQDDATGYVRAIRKFDVDKFRPLNNYLNGKTGGTDETNIELLAWLIDFDGRPYQAGIDRKAEKPGIRSIASDEPHVTATTPMQAKRDISVFVSRTRHLLIGLSLIILTAGAGYVIWAARSASKASKGCMIWAGDHYQPISCNEKNGQVMVIALDTIKVAHFKKITRPDTITSRALGRVWYSKISNNVEYFTADGFNPVHIERHLKPLTQYMIDKHISLK